MAKKQVFKVGDTAYLKLKYENILKCQVASVGEQPQGWRRVMKETVTVREIMEDGTLNKREWTVWNSRSHILCEEEGKELYEKYHSKRVEQAESRKKQWEAIQEKSNAWENTPSAQRALRIAPRLRIWREKNQKIVDHISYSYYGEDVQNLSKVLDEEFGPPPDPNYMKEGC